ncbi:protein ROLLING AND ERECT LEAF 2-like [Nymphaea colorata]|nr:protein ROLLING AND ERECT LEAF 2-like [Nymphaea colorata]
MGCATSRLEGEDTVSQCKERRRLMKQAVKSRHLFAAAHSDYLHHLRLTGAALSNFAAGESLTVSEGTPPVFLHRALSSSADHPPRPPPLQSTANSHSFRAVSASTSHLPSPANPHPPAKTLPTGIMSGKTNPASFFTSSPTHSNAGSSRSSNFPFAGKPLFADKTNSVYSNMSPSQSSSSMWNWENFYPPSPPGSDFYRQRAEVKSREHEAHATAEHDDHTTGEREEVRCSDWGDGYFCSTSASSSDDEDGRSGGAPENAESRSESWVPAESADKFSRKSDTEEVVDSSVKWNDGVAELKIVRRHKDLAEIAAALEECFVKAAEAGKEVAEFLEMDREQLDRNFRNLTKKVYHSNNFFANLSSSWTSRPPLAIKYSMQAGALTESGGRKSHCSTLEQLLAWEKKLYEEVKAREAAKIGHEKKLHSLQSQEYRGEKEAKLDKTKASIKKFQSLIMVASQAVTTTSSAITAVRDNELGPQLLEFCYRLMKMWKSMNHVHEIQNDIVQQVRGLINRSDVGESTTELHRQSTHHLQLAVSGWHSSFFQLTKHHRDYIHSLHSWLRLTLYRLDDSTENGSEGIVPAASESASKIYNLCEEWRHAVDRLPDTVASEAIKSFVTVVQAISLQQSEELRCRKRSEASARELEKKTAALRALEKKFYGSVSSYSLAGINVPGSGSDPTTIDARDPLADKRLVVASCRRKAEEELSKHAKAVQVTRAMTLNNVQTGLPGVFQAMTAFSGVCSDTIEAVYNHARETL